jgi:hypothetical protein
MAKVPQLLVQRVSLWQKRSKLDAWEIEIEFEPLGKRDAVARWPDHANRATIAFNSTTYSEWTDEKVNLIICHELYHVLTARVDDVINDYIGRVGSVYRAYSKADEAAADSFATAFVSAYRRKRS